MMMTVMVSILVMRGCAWMLQLLLVMPDLQGITPRRTRRRLPVMIAVVRVDFRSLRYHSMLGKGRASHELIFFSV